MWANQVERGDRTVTRFSIIIEKRYRDDDGNWRTARTLFPRDLPMIALVAQKAFEFTTIRESEEQAD